MLLKLILCTSLLLSFNLHAKKADLNSSKLKKNSITFREIKEHKKNINKKKKEPKFNLASTNGKFLFMFYHAKTKEDIAKIKMKVFASDGKAIPAIIEVMKSNVYPDKNRWLATFLLGRTMGKKSGAFISKFLSHPNWVLRMASLKTLLALRAKKYGMGFARLLKDKSFIVRTQALENIKQLKLREYSPYIWQMLYDKSNYYSTQKKIKKSKVSSGKQKPKSTTIVKNIILAIGDLQFLKAKGPLLKMAGKKKYIDIFDEIDYSLTRITGKKSPAGPLSVKKRYWKRVSMSEAKI
ncbi:MAG: hypothetical protein HN576_12920 [Bacteriovoracaceae bacterium]|nr:hypothetical protein [Bacteriovoracaceae bacterium]